MRSSTFGDYKNRAVTVVAGTKNARAVGASDVIAELKLVAWMFGGLCGGALPLRLR
jgi:hypothetical protein